MDSPPHAATELEPEAQAPDLVPARMLNEVCYCPRLAYIEWVEGDFRDSVYTAEGRLRHRNVDRPGGPAPERAPATASSAAEPAEHYRAGAVRTSGTDDAEDGSAAPTEIHARSIQLSAYRAGITACIDLLEGEGDQVTPVEYKRGAPPKNRWQSHLPERVQLCAQGLVLEENGYSCTGGVLYFAGARRRVEVPFSDDLRARTLAAVAELRELAGGGTLPPVLKDSPKCNACSLAGVCLPDEVDLLAVPTARGKPRRLFPARDDAVPLHVCGDYGTITVRDECLWIRVEQKEPVEVRIGETASIALHGNIGLTAQAVRKLCQRGVPVSLFSRGGWFYGMILGVPYSNIRLRRLQFEAGLSAPRKLRIARSLVAQKIKNQRTMLRRNAKEDVTRTLNELKILARKAEAASDQAELLGLEGSAARAYFGSFSKMLDPKRKTAEFHLDGRNRRPPTDPVNALLSFAYALLVRQCTVVCAAVGFDPFLGFYHTQRPRRPALALDIMEPFRPLVADSVVINAINNPILRPSEFTRRLGAVTIDPLARKKIIRTFERRMDQPITHPIFDYRINYRRTLEVQVRLLGRYLAGELAEPPTFTTR